MSALVPVVSGPAETVPGFFGWWAGELRDLLPARWRRRGAPRRCILLVPDDHGLYVHRRSGRRITPRGCLTHDHAADTAALARRLARGSEAIWLLLPAGDGLIARDSLPAGAERDLGKIMRHRVEVLTPLPAAMVLSDARVIERRADRSLGVELAVVGRDVVDPLLLRMAALGLTPAGIDLADRDGMPSGFDFLGGAGRRPRVGLRRRLPAILAAVVALTLTGWAAANVLEVERELAQKRRHLAALEERFADLPALRERLESKRERANFVAERRRDAISPTVVLEVMSRLLPDDVWLTEMQLAGREMVASGYARDAATVVPLIEGSPHFSQVRFRTPSTRTELPSPDGSTRRVERFSVTAAVAPLLEPGR